MRLNQLKARTEDGPRRHYVTVEYTIPHYRIVSYRIVSYRIVSYGISHYYIHNLSLSLSICIYIYIYVYTYIYIYIYIYTLRGGLWAGWQAAARSPSLAPAIAHAAEDPDTLK